MKALTWKENRVVKKFLRICKKEYGGFFRRKCIGYLDGDIKITLSDLGFGFINTLHMEVPKKYSEIISEMRKQKKNGVDLNDALKSILMANLSLSESDYNYIFN